MRSNATPAAAIIGGSGLYELFDDPEKLDIDTPFGSPSAPVSIGTIGDVRVAFLPRHGQRHEYSPHQVNYRANLWALRSLGVTQVLSACAVGSLDWDVGPGSIVVPDQMIDRTYGRECSVWDRFEEVVHIGFADPYCGTIRSTICSSTDLVHPTGTMVVINGPRFSTRAESSLYTAAGGTIIGMTGAPEAVIARELAMCYAAIALVTDFDVGGSDVPPVAHAEVLRTFEAHVASLRRVLESTINLLAARDGQERVCGCQRALDDFDVKNYLSVPADRWPQQ